MGADKAMLGWDGSTMLQTITATLHAAVPRVIVAAAQEQALPSVDAVIVRDPVPDEGPLRGLATGLSAAHEAGFGWALTTATDIPLLSVEVLRQLLGAVPTAAADATAGNSTAERVDVILAVADGRDQPLIAMYRTDLAEEARTLLDQGRRGLRDLLAGLVVRRVPVADEVSALNVNTPADAERGLWLLSRRAPTVAGQCDGRPAQHFPQQG